MTTFFIVVGGLGVGLLLLGLLLDDVLDGLFDVFDAGGALSAPVIGAFLGAFGIGGWLAQSTTDNTAIALVAAGAAGLVLGFVALRLSLALVGMHTDATPTSGDYLGQIGRVVTPIAGGRGEVMVRMGGTPRKLTASSEHDIDRGVEVVVVEVLSPNAVTVMPTTELFQQET